MRWRGRTDADPFSTLIDVSRRRTRPRDPDRLGDRPPADQVDFGKRSYVVAPVTPLDVTGVRTVAVGTIAWVVAFLALVPFYRTLQHDDRLWWLWTCLAGVGLGLLGLEYCRRRRDRLVARSDDEVASSSPLGAPGP
jgi:Protein of unknown function (DUF2530)